MENIILLIQFSLGLNYWGFSTRITLIVINLLLENNTPSSCLTLLSRYATPLKRREVLMICCTIVSFICRAMTWSITKERRSVSSKIKLDLHNSKWPLRYKSINHSLLLEWVQMLEQRKIYLVFTKYSIICWIKQIFDLRIS